MNRKPDWPFDSTINLWYGCTRCSIACQNCWAENMARRFRYAKSFHKLLAKGGKWNGKIVVNENWKIPDRDGRGMFFVQDMGDFLDPNAPDEVRSKFLWEVEHHPWQEFFFTTKRYMEYAKSRDMYISNLWEGLTIWDQQSAVNAEFAIESSSVWHPWLCVEPLLGEIWRLPKPTKQIRWIMVGCETGPKARLCRTEDIRFVVRQAKDQDIPVWVKALPIDGKPCRDWAKWPEDLRVRERPVDSLSD